MVGTSFDIRPTTTVFVCHRISDTEGCASPTVISSSDDPSVPRSLRELLQLKGAYATASTVFNTSAKKGLAALGQALGRDLTPRDVACFLRFGTGLSECGVCTRPVPVMPSLCRPHVLGLQHQDLPLPSADVASLGGGGWVPPASLVKSLPQRPTRIHTHLLHTRRTTDGTGRFD